MSSSSPETERGPRPEGSVRHFLPGVGEVAEAPQRTEREERVDRLLLLAERLRRRDRPSRGRTLLEEALRLSPDDPRALRALVQDGHRRAPAGEEAPGLREVAGRPGAWRARSLLAVEQVPPGSDGDSSLCRAWLDSALEAAPASAVGTVWDMVLGGLAAREAWGVLAVIAEPLLEETHPPARASIFAIDAWLRSGQREPARQLAALLPARVLDRQPWAASLRVATRRPAPAGQEEARPELRSHVVLSAPLWEPETRRAAGRLAILLPAVPVALAEEAPQVLRVALDLAHQLERLGEGAPRIVLRRDARSRVLAPAHPVEEIEQLEAELAAADVDAPLVLTGRWRRGLLGGLLGSRRLELRLWDRELRRVHTLRTSSTRAAALRLAARLRRRRGPGERTRLRVAPRGERLQLLDAAGFHPRCQTPRREALVALLAERISRSPESLPAATGDAWRGWWQAEPTALPPRQLAAALAERRLPREASTRAAVLRELVRAPATTADATREGNLVSRLRGL